MFCVISFFGLGPKSKPDLWKIIAEVDGINERRVKFVCKVNSHTAFYLTQTPITYYMDCVEFNVLSNSLLKKDLLQYLVKFTSQSMN